MTFDKSIFNKLNASEVEQLLKDLESSRTEIHCKGKADDVYKLRVSQLKSTSIDCLLLNDSAQPELTIEQVIVSFFIGAERYFFTSELAVGKEKYSVKNPTEIFHLQRRQNYRFRLPASYPAYFKIQKHNGRSIQLVAKIIDISAGGCKISLVNTEKNPLPKFLVNDLFEGTLEIKSKANLTVTTQTRYSGEDKLDKNTFVLGLQFAFLSPIMESKLYALSLELYRETALG
ncbi:MAG: PilZ domain-containing protein [Flammeovirgaceae bacterium]|jgi:c-di-GMP-binding flagellar brake protein YcgR|nr:PilZ domain-containing protein [Flammeovirgaceae bacterium]